MNSSSIRKLKNLYGRGKCFCFALCFKKGIANDQNIYASYFYAICGSILIKKRVKESISIWLFVVINFS